MINGSLIVAPIKLILTFQKLIESIRLMIFIKLTIFLQRVKLIYATNNIFLILTRLF